MKFGSLFSGIGGIDLGLERAGMQCQWQVEIDDYATRVLEKHWPQVPRFRDIRDCGAHNLAPVDLIAGGFPCQDVSLAGARAGITGARSGLWKEFARIIRELRPHFVLVENVPGLLSGGMGEVLGDLASLGFDAEWESLPAVAFGAPYRRYRVFIFAQLMRQRGREEWHEPIGQQEIEEALLDNRLNASWRDAHINCFRKLEQKGSLKKERGRIGDCTWWETEPCVARLVPRIPKGMDRHRGRRRRERIRGLGNTAIPQALEFIGKQILGGVK